MSCVLRPWVCLLQWKQQSVLLSGLRGPDTGHCPKIKDITRWMRNVTQNNADPEHSYMRVSIEGLPKYAELEKELEYTSVHFLHHFAQALKVISYGCDDDIACTYAHRLYVDICTELLHVYPESDGSFAVRLRDKVEHE